jgi:hypothetical protein
MAASNPLGVLAHQRICELEVRADRARLIAQTRVSLFRAIDFSQIRRSCAFRLIDLGMLILATTSPATQEDPMSPSRPWRRSQAAMAELLARERLDCS